MSTEETTESAPPPPAAADLAAATLWFYADASGQTQGPFSVENMRQWFSAGYMPPSSTLCAPSFYGEVPSDMWLLSTLFPSDADVFGAASAAASSSADAEQEQSAALQHQHARAPAAQQKSAPIGPARSGGRGAPARAAPYARPSGSQDGADSSAGKGGRGSGGKGGEKGGGGKGGKGGKGKGKGEGMGDAISRRAPPHVLRFEAARSMQLGMIGGTGKATGGGMKEGRDVWSGRRA